MFGIAWGIVSIILMVAAGEGMREGQAKVAEQFGKDVLIVNAGRTSLQAGGTRAGRIIRFEADDYRYVQGQSPSCKYVLPELGQGNVPVRSAYNNGALLVTGSLPDFADIRSIPVGESRYPDWDDEAEGRHLAFLGSDAKTHVFASRPAVGETIRVGDSATGGWRCLGHALRERAGLLLDHPEPRGPGHGPGPRRDRQAPALLPDRQTSGRSRCSGARSSGR